MDQYKMNLAEVTTRVELLEGLDDGPSIKFGEPTLQATIRELYELSYVHQTDRRHRKLCLDLAQRLLVLQAPTVISSILDILDQTMLTHSSTLAAADNLVSLDWVHLCLGFVSISDAFERLILIQACLIGHCSGLQAKPAIQKAVCRRVFRVIRSLLESKPDLRHVFIHTYVRILTQSSTAHKIHGHLLGILTRLAIRAPELGIMGTLKEDRRLGVDFYVNNFLGSKTSLPISTCVGFGPFLEHIITFNDLADTIVPAINKALLRAPELVTSPTVEYFLKKAMLEDVNASNLLVDRLSQPLIILLKSINQTTRNGALCALRALFARAGENIDRIMASLLSALSNDKPAIEQRTQLAKAICFCPLSSKTIESHLKILSSIILRESNEVVLTTLVSCYLSALRTALAASKSVPECCLGCLDRGLSEKRVGLRNRWTCGLAALQRDMPNESVQVVDSVQDSLVKSWLLDSKAPMVALTCGAISSLYASTSILLNASTSSTSISKKLDPLSFHSGLYSKTTPSSFVYASRIYSRLSPGQEPLELIALLHDIAKHANQEELKTVASSWASTALFVMAAFSAAHELRRGILKMGDVQKQQTVSMALLAETTISAWDITSSYAQTQKYLLTATRISVSGLINRKDVDIENVHEMLLNFLVAAHHPSLAGRALWIKTIQSLGVDPGEFVHSAHSKLLKFALSHISFHEAHYINCKTEAACSALTTLAFLCPVEVTQKLVAHFEDDYSNRLSDVDNASFGAWLMTEPHIFMDAISKAEKLTLDPTNTEDWQATDGECILRRHASLMSTISSSLENEKDQKSRIAKQQRQEHEMRDKINDDLFRVKRGLCIISSLNKSFVDKESWLAQAVACLLSDTTSRTRPFLGSLAVDTYLECTSNLGRFGLESRSIGVAALAMLDYTRIEDKQEIVTRVLYRLRSESEKGLLELDVLICALPLLVAVTNHGSRARPGQRHTDEKVVEEHIFLVLETLKFNTEAFTSSSLPRLATIEALTAVIGSRPAQAAEAKAILRDLVAVMSLNATRQEIASFCQGFSNDEANIRNAVLCSAEPLDLTGIGLSLDLWLATNDDISHNAELAMELFNANGMTVDINTRTETLQFLQSKSAYARQSAPRAIARTFDRFPEGMTDVLDLLVNLYYSLVADAPPVYDRFGQLVVKQQDTRMQTEVSRIAIASTLTLLAALNSFDSVHASKVIQFLFSARSDSCSPTTDPSAGVRKAMLDLGFVAVRYHGREAIESLLPILEGALQSSHESKATDWSQEIAVVLYGAVASNLNSTDPRIPKVLDKLLQSLDTPSETVQMAIGQCLPPLVRGAPQHQTDYVHSLLNTLSEGITYAARRGAAYGLAGVSRGCGLISLNRMGILESLESAIRNRKDFKARQGSLLAYECFSSSLGILFEPYMTSVIPLLLITFADTDAAVRSSTHDTARAMMSSISGFGVQQILPFLLSGLDDHQWRSKKGSVELIGAMAYCAPKQLSRSLPTIIPRLNEVLTDSHAQVRAAANTSLSQFGEVISNPEIQQLVPDLLRALSDPNRYTDAALDKLLRTSFLHYIDPASLSILTPIIERGMQERSGTMKKKSAKIFGLMASLTDPNDLIGHLTSLVPCLMIVLMDTVPDVRATAAKSLGTLVEQLGERNFPNLVEDLLGILNSDVAGTDRQGAAQGLSEVLAGLGTDRLDDTLPRILQDSRSKFSYVREAYISLLIYLPATFGSRFSPYLAKSIAPILTGLADESEFVREASLRAGRIMIANYASKSVDLMLPELEGGMFNDAWRIRVSSLQLIGDLLFKVSGISTLQKGDDDDDETTVATEVQRSTLIEILGLRRRDRILASLYIARFDAFAMVRSSAINVWKTLVANTPKTLKEILPSLIDSLIENLSTVSREKRTVFVDALGELTRKMGQELLSQLLPAFEHGLHISHDQRLGVCVAMTELIQNSSLEQLQPHEDRLVSIVKSALLTPEAEVRAAANFTFNALQSQFGARIVDRILPELLSMLQTESQANNALEALKGVMHSRSNAVLPALLPGLLQRPMTDFNLHALGGLVDVAGTALTRHLSSILNTVMEAEILHESDFAGAAFEEVLSSIPDGAESTSIVMNIMLDLAKHEMVAKQSACCSHLAFFFSQTKTDFSRYISDWLRVLLDLLGAVDDNVVRSAWQALDALTKSIRKEQLAQYVTTARRSLQSACPASKELPGFSLPKGISVILPIFLQGLLYGTTDQKSEAAIGLGDIVLRTQSESLKNFVTQITGPLIRIIGERSSPETKSAILSTLQLLMKKIPAALKPFLPQLQRSFTKALIDTSEAVRAKSASALGALLELQSTRVDSLIGELVHGYTNVDQQIRSSMLCALFEVVAMAGHAMAPASKDQILSLVQRMSLASDNKEDLKKAADLLGVLFRVLSDEQALSVLRQSVLDAESNIFSVNALNRLLISSPDKVTEVSGEIATYLAGNVASTDTLVSQRAIAAAGKVLLNSDLNQEFIAVKRLLTALARTIDADGFSVAPEEQRLALIVIRAVGSRFPALLRPHLELVALPVFSCVRSMIIPVRLTAELAFVAIFQMKDYENKLLTQFVSKLEPNKARSMTEYARRVASKLALAETERTEAGIMREDEDDLEEILNLL